MKRRLPNPAVKREKPGARPFVFINMAMTADGKIATANRAVSSFGSPRDQQHLLEVRSTADAVMAGARTVDLNRITLGPGPAKYRRLRTKRGLAEYNLRIVVSRSGSVNPAAEVFQRKFSPVVVLTSGRANWKRLEALRKIATEVKICGRKSINFLEALAWLRKKWKVRRLLCEGGGELNDALFRAGVVDEVHLTVCPRVFGGRGAPTIAEGEGASCLSAAAQLTLKSVRRLGDEKFLVYQVNRKRRPHRGRGYG
jgi:riboflavin-specific deaminase-like protein